MSSAVIAYRLVPVLFLDGRREVWALKVRRLTLAIHPREEDRARARWRRSYRRLAQMGRISR